MVCVFVRFFGRGFSLGGVLGGIQLCVCLLSLFCRLKFFCVWENACQFPAIPPFVICPLFSFRHVGPFPQLGFQASGPVEWGRGENTVLYTGTSQYIVVVVSWCMSGRWNLGQFWWYWGFPLCSRNIECPPLYVPGHREQRLTWGHCLVSSSCHFAIEGSKVKRTPRRFEEKAEACDIRPCAIFPL